MREWLRRLVAPASDVPRVFTSGRSTLTQQHGVRHLRLDEPDAYHAGWATGRLLADSGDAMVRLLRLPLLGVVAWLACRIARRHVARVVVPADVGDELRGLADATGIRWHTLFFANVVFDVAKRYGFHCSTLVFFGQGTVRVGRNTDLLPALAALALRVVRPLVVEVTLPGQARYTHVSVPCFVGVLNGWNDHGIAVHSHQVIHVAEDPHGPRLASSLLMRRLLEGADSLAAAEAIARQHPTMRSLNVVVASVHEQRGLVLEVHPDRLHVLAHEGDFGCGTHFASDAMRPLHDGPIDASEQRLASMQALIARSPQPDLAALRTMLQDSRHGLRHRLSGRSVSNEGTFQSFAVDVARGVVVVSNGVRRPVSTSGRPVTIEAGAPGVAAAPSPVRPAVDDVLRVPPRAAPAWLNTEGRPV